VWRASARAALPLLIGLVLLEVVAPSLVVYGAQLAFAGGPGREVNVKVKAFPRAKMLLGQFDSVKLNYRDYPTPELTLDRLELEVSELRVLLCALLLRQEFRIQAPLLLTFEAEIGEQRLSDYWQERVRGLAGPVRAEGDQLSIELHLEAGGRRLRVQVRGKPEVTAAGGIQCLRITPEEVLVAERRLPEALRKPVLELLRSDLLSVPLELGGVSWTDATVIDGSLVLSGQLNQVSEDLVLPFSKNSDGGS
jgi:hypothetical protein